MSPGTPPGGGRTPRFSVLLAVQLANDLRALLGVMVDALDTVRMQMPADGSTDRAFAAIDGAIDASFRICRELTTLGAPARPAPIAVNVNEVILRLTPLLERILGDGRLLLTLDTSMPEIRADEAHLEWILLNLVANAREAMRQGGVLTVETSIVEAPAGGPDGSPPGRTYVRLTVSDTGHGMGRSVRERAFEPFFSTKPTGFGLGLTSVALTALLLHGKVSIEEDDAAGTQVHVYLPLLKRSDGHQPG